MRKLHIGGLCNKGHTITMETLYVQPSGGKATCKLCKDANNKIYRQKYRARYIERSAAWYKNNKKRAKQLSRDNYLTRRFGISTAEYEELCKRQDNRCAICNETPAERKDKLGRVPSILYVDHCHANNKVRKLLCHWCNTGLGHFRDNPNLLRNAATYVEDFTNVISTSV